MPTIGAWKGKPVRRRARIDANQPEIVKALRDMGASVEPRLARIGEGVPDLLVGFRNQNLLLQVKNGSKAPSARKLTPDERVWHGRWEGQLAVVKNVKEALAVLLSIPDTW